jgi:phospholipid/cholesterol/gamma-HCH transport system substrate-binding protein
METRAHYVLIGAFVLCAIASAFLFILYLSQANREYDPYDVIFTERVSGLSVGAAVLFNGIQKGEVVKLDLDENDPSIVIARVHVEKKTRVKTDTKAELELVGFTGLAVIQFVGGSKDAKDLKDVVKGVPQIKADASGFAAFLEGSGDIVEGANRLLSTENTEAFARILLNIEALTKTFADQDENIAATIENSAQMTADLAAASKSLNALSADLQKLTRNDAPLVVADARATLKSTQALMDELNAVVAENRESFAATTQGLAQIGPAVAEARRTMRTLDQVLREIDRDPRGYLLGESTPKYEAETP